jgi:DNA polymerase I-like protein with 3'-5' exonuclease and polymerase domains
MKTGRTSCSNPPIQQLPREEGPRECFIPRDGYAFVAVDGAVAELVSFAQTLLDLFGESNLADILREGRDPHMELAKTFTDEPTSEDRRRAKPVSFGLPGRMGPRGLAEYARTSYGVDMTIYEAREAIRQWHSLDPSFEKYFEWLRSLEVNGLIAVELPWNGMLCGDLYPTQAANILFQGRTAHAFKRALWNLTKRQYDDGFRLVTFLHDEIIAEAPLDRVHEVGQIVSEEIVRAYREVCPDVPLRAEPTAMLRWSKAAKPTYVDGRLVPWVP